MDFLVKRKYFKFKYKNCCYILKEHKFKPYKK